MYSKSSKKELEVVGNKTEPAGFHLKTLVSSDLCFAMSSSASKKKTVAAALDKGVEAFNRANSILAHMNQFSYRLQHGSYVACSNLAKLADNALISPLDFAYVAGLHGMSVFMNDCISRLVEVCAVAPELADASEQLTNFIQSLPKSKDLMALPHGARIRVEVIDDVHCLSAALDAASLPSSGGVKAETPPPSYPRDPPVRKSRSDTPIPDLLREENSGSHALLRKKRRRVVKFTETDRQFRAPRPLYRPRSPTPPYMPPVIMSDFTPKNGKNVGGKKPALSPCLLDFDDDELTTTCEESPEEAAPRKKKAKMSPEF